MIVLRSTYDALEKKLVQEQAQHAALLAKWNELATKINARGGQAFLDNGSIGQFSRDELRTLLVLCHPDKHGSGSQAKAEAITRKILALR